MIITTLHAGANSVIGIGRATVHHFANNGARAVFVCDFNDDHLATHKRELESLYPGVDIHTRKFDAANEEAVKRICEEALEKYGRLDVFFANAGIGSAKLFTECTGDDFMNMMRVNTLSVFLAAKYGSKAMMKTSKDKPYPAGSIRRCSPAEMQDGSAEHVSLNRQCSGHSIQRRIQRLQCRQGSCHFVNADMRLPAQRYWNKVQRDLPRYNRDRDDKTNVRYGTSAGDRE